MILLSLTRCTYFSLLLPPSFVWPFMGKWESFLEVIQFHRAVKSTALKV